MAFNSKQTKLAILWIMPTALEVFVYAFISAITFAISNLAFFRQSLFLPTQFNLYHDVINSISQLIERAVGERIAGSLSLGIFWGLVGMIVYVVIWLIQNFSTELSNDLAMTKYVYPRGADPESSLRNFISLTVFRLIIFVLFVFYINLVVRVLFLHWLNVYQNLLHHWLQSGYLFRALVALLTQMIILHGFVVFTRLLFLRKRIFS